MYYYYIVICFLFVVFCHFRRAKLLPNRMMLSATIYCTL